MRMIKTTKMRHWERHWLLSVCAAHFVGGVISLSLVAILASVSLADALVFAADAAGPQQGLVQQFRAQYEPALKVELSFVNRVCKLNDEQRRLVIAKSVEWLDEHVKKVAKAGGQPQPVGVWLGGNQSQAENPRDVVQKNMDRIVKKELPKEAAEIYAKESKEREEFLKRTAVDNLVAKIDKELILTPEQQKKISDALYEHYDPSWAQLEMFMHGMDMWPSVPDQWVRPYLTVAQKLAWGRISKNAHHVFFGGMGVEGQAIDDIDLDEGKVKSDEDTTKDPAPNVVNAAEGVEEVIRAGEVIQVE